MSKNRNFYRVRLGRSLSKKAIATNNNKKIVNPGEKRTDFESCHIVLIKMFSFQQRIMEHVKK
jgi:hypothetical protein